MPIPETILFNRGFFPGRVAENNVEARPLAKKNLRECDREVEGRYRCKYPASVLVDFGAGERLEVLEPACAVLPERLAALVVQARSR